MHANPKKLVGGAAIAATLGYPPLASAQGLRMPPRRHSRFPALCTPCRQTGAAGVPPAIGAAGAGAVRRCVCGRRAGCAMGVMRLGRMTPPRPAHRPGHQTPASP
jgi:hypothetical protein